MSDREYAFVCTQRDIDPTPEQAAADRAADEEITWSWHYFHPEEVAIDPAWLSDDAYFHPETWGQWVMP